MLADSVRPRQCYFKPTHRHSFLPCKTPQRSRRSSLTAKSNTTSIDSDHLQYIEEVAAAVQPENLGALLKVLQAQSLTIVQPSDRSNLHPLVIPLSAHSSKDEESDITYTCLLRQVALSNTNDQVMPVVQMRRGSSYLTLAARNTQEYLHRALAEEDITSGPGAIAEAAGQAGQAIYTTGNAASNLNAYLTRKAGMYPDIVEQLVANHLQKGDSMSALITSEWYMRPKHFSGWARPYEFSARLYKQLGRLEESRDSARVALRLPWWSLSTGFEAVRQMAGLQGDASGVHRALKEQTYAANGALPPGAMPAKDDRQVLLEDAEFLMNRASAGEVSWDEIRPQLADKYRQAGLPDIAEFVLQ
ncbi:TPA: hypothetical protein ACH3X1_009374 [Trebouxia sp. C0004]